MKTSLGTEVDLRGGHIVLDGFPALRERGTASPSCRHMCIVATVTHLSYCWALVIFLLIIWIMTFHPLCKKSMFCSTTCSYSSCHHFLSWTCLRESLTIGKQSLKQVVNMHSKLSNAVSVSIAEYVCSQSTFPIWSLNLLIIDSENSRTKRGCSFFGS